MTLEPEMMIRVVEKRGQAPTVDDEGKEVWYGGYGDSSQEEASLSASILTASAPDFEIGTWYTLLDFEQKVAGINEDPDAGWTMITIDQVGVEVATVTSIFVPQITAAKTIGTSLGVDAVEVARRSGTTTFVDAGSAGPGAPAR